MKNTIVCLALALTGAAFAETVIDVTGAGAEKFTVAIKVSDANYAKCLKRNLERSGVFVVQDSGSITVSGAPGAAVKAEGRGKVVTSTAAVSDEKSARMAARKLSDAMCEAFAQQKGFACDPVAFVNRKGKDNAELCITYPDGYDIRQLTSDSRGLVGPRWKDRNTLFYTFLKSGPQVYEYDLANQRRKLRWSFKGLTTGAAVSPDGNRVAIILSFQGNPELYVIDGERYTRLTNTPNASEGQPSWSPDGKKIVYVSDETRHPQLYVKHAERERGSALVESGRQEDRLRLRRNAPSAALHRRCGDEGEAAADLEGFAERRPRLGARRAHHLHHEARRRRTGRRPGSGGRRGRGAARDEARHVGASVVVA